MLAGDTGRVFVVGDDDQSIYGWRGAKVENVHHFLRDFPDVRTVRLEQNYRSTGNILKAANALIGHNEGRMGKKLWTAGPSGNLIQLYAAFNEQDEARFVVDRIDQWLDEGHRAEDSAILYRTTAQSRLFEEYLLRSIFHIVYMAARGSSNAPKSRMLWLTCACYTIPTTTQPWSE